MNTLKDALYENVGKIQHLRTYEFLKILEKNTDPDGISRITYKKWKEEFGIHAFILNCCVEESQKLGLIKVLREGRDGTEKKGAKGIRRVYKLLVSANNTPPKNATTLEKDKKTDTSNLTPKIKKKATKQKTKPPVPAKKRVTAKKKVVKKAA